MPNRKHNLWITAAKFDIFSYYHAHRVDVVNDNLFPVLSSMDFLDLNYWRWNIFPVIVNCPSFYELQEITEFVDCCYLTTFSVMSLLLSC